MEIAIWSFAGALLGWASWKYFGFNAQRGMLVSTLTGAVGAFVGGNLVAPLLVNAAAASGSGVPALFIAALVAAGFLVAGNLLQRWGI